MSLRVRIRSGSFLQPLLHRNQVSDFPGVKRKSSKQKYSFINREGFVMGRMWSLLAWHGSGHKLEAQDACNHEDITRNLLPYLYTECHVSLATNPRYLKLLELGLKDCLKGIDAHRVVGCALFKGGRDAKVGYPLEGYSFHNGRFIQKMREKASTLRQVKLEQGTVLSRSFAVMFNMFNMRHPLTGGGMTVALSDIVLLRDMLRPLRNFQDAESLSDYMHRRFTLAASLLQPLYTLAGALYKVFCDSPDPAMKEMRQACFDYLSTGGVVSSGPVALLSGLNPRPLSLVVHFFAVAVYGVGRLIIPFPSPARMWIGARLIWGASNIVFPIVKAEGVRQMFFPGMVPAYYKAPPPECAHS